MIFEAPILELITQLGIMFLYLILGILLLLKIYKQKLRVPYLMSAVISGLVSTTFNFIGFFVWEGIQPYFLVISLSGNVIFVFIFYLFIESCDNLKVNTTRFSIVLTISVIQQFSNFFTALLFANSNQLFIDFDSIARITYGILSIIVFGIFGTQFYFRSYKLTKERLSILFIFVMLITAFGIGLIIYGNLLYRFNISTILINNLLNIMNLIALLLFTLNYLLHLDYVYRLPHDYYFLLISYHSGIPIYSTKIQSRKEVDVDENLVAGFLSAIRSLFGTSLNTSPEIQQIASKDAVVFMEANENIVITIIGEKATKKLSQATNRLLSLIQHHFQKELTDQISEMSQYEQKISEFIPQCFPFFKLRI